LLFERRELPLIKDHTCKLKMEKKLKRLIEEEEKKQGNEDEQERWF
jgi:hypothetical protein